MAATKEELYGRSKDMSCLWQGVCNREKRYCSEGCSREARIKNQKIRNKELSRKPRPISTKPRGNPEQVSSLLELTKKAREAGITYGQYVALEYVNHKSYK